MTTGGSRTTCSRPRAKRKESCVVAEKRRRKTPFSFFQRRKEKNEHAFLPRSLSSLSPTNRPNGFFLVAQARRASPLLALAVRGAQRRHGCRAGALRVRLGAGCRAGGAHGREDAGEKRERRWVSGRGETISSTPTSTCLSHPPPRNHSRFPRESQRWLLCAPAQRYPKNKFSIIELMKKPPSNNRPSAPLATKSARRSRLPKRLSNTSTRLAG